MSEESEKTVIISSGQGENSGKPAGEPIKDDKKPGDMGKTLQKAFDPANKVQCRYCPKMIRNDPEAIREHERRQHGIRVNRVKGVKVEESSEKTPEKPIDDRHEVITVPVRIVKEPAMPAKAVEAEILPVKSPEDPEKGHGLDLVGIMIAVAIIVASGFLVLSMRKPAATRPALPAQPAAQPTAAPMAPAAPVIADDPEQPTDPDVRGITVNGKRRYLPRGAPIPQEWLQG